MEGLRFGRLVVLGDSGQRRRGQVLWLCWCDCGGDKVAVANDLKRLFVQSCGCYRLERLHQAGLKHGGARRSGWTPTYSSWKSMMERCCRPNSKSYSFYGGRGITVCQQWHSFPSFLADMGDRPTGLTLDRIDSAGNYEPANCRWASLRQQNMNRRNNRLFRTLDDELISLSDASRYLAMNSGTLWRRFIQAGVITKCLTTRGKRRTGQAMTQLRKSEPTTEPKRS